jgi:hypothetical protein
METLGDILVTKNEQKTSDKFFCEFCNYRCCKKYNWDRHLMTAKHSKVTDSEQNGAKNEQNEQNEQKTIKQFKNKYFCENCQKSYESRNGLWKHKSKGLCLKKEQVHIYEEHIEYHNKETSDKDLIAMLINDNKEFKQLIIEICKEKDEYKNIMLKVLENGTNNTTHTNSHNKSFNLNFFLNETCKDAMNIMDFVDSIKLQLSDLENVGKVGYVNGISNIIVKNLNALDITQRPVHCTDKKREIIYIKDDDKWEKDDEENKKFRKVIKKIATKNACLIPKFKEAHPDCSKSTSKFSDQYNKIIVESMGGSGDNDVEKEEKIIKNISKQILIDK